MAMSRDDLTSMGLVWDERKQAYVKKGSVRTEKPVYGKGSSFVGAIFIPGNVPSLKNSKRILFKNGESKGQVKCYRNGKAVHPFIGSSKLVEEYSKGSARYYEAYRDTFLELVSDHEPPYLVQFVFVRSSRRGYDFNNANHMVTDMMKKYGWLEDDDMSNILPLPKLTAPHSYHSPKGAGVWITPKNKEIFHFH